jgi:integrase
LTQITTTDLVAFAANRKKLVTSPKTAINQIALLKLMFSQAKQWGYLDINPAVDLKRPKDSKKEIEILTPTELNLLTESLTDHYRMAFKTAIMTGVRAGELWALKWADFQPATKQLFVRRSVWKGQFQAPNTKNSIRVIDLPDEFVHELKVWKLTCPPNANDLMFPSPEGEISQHDNVTHRSFLPTLRKANLRQVSFHSLRNASLRIKAGQNPKYLSRQMGHASVAFPLDVYGHLFDDDPQFYRDQAGLLNDALKVKDHRGGVQLGVHTRKKGLKRNA